MAKLRGTLRTLKPQKQDRSSLSEILLIKIDLFWEVQSSAFRHVDETASNNLKRKIP